MKRLRISLFLFLCIALFLPQIAVSLTWYRTFDRRVSGSGSSVAKTTDGGYIISGTFRNQSSVSASLFKLDARGDVVWSKAYGRTRRFFVIHRFRQTKDGGLVAVGRADSSLWVLKLHSDGNMIWQKAYGEAFAVVPDFQETSDGGFIVAAESSDGDFY